MVRIPNKSRSRRLQYEWLARHDLGVERTGRVLDLGGVRAAEYHALLDLAPGQVVVWNLDSGAAPDVVVDLDDAAGLPPFPADCSAVLALNLLEHLYRPFELLEWACRGLRPGGRLLALVPFAYPIHPSPADYWRITPQAFERFFGELAARRGVTGQVEVAALGEDLREGTSALTSELFKSTRARRLLGMLIESSTLAASIAAAAVMGQGGRERVRQWARRNPGAVGVAWTKS